ncbi:MAG: hypothetical protein ABI091_28505 [Ferruginibacter sp.]
MVKVISVKKSESKKDGKEFFSLKVQGGVEAVQSQETGRMYLTIRTCFVSTTFDEQTATSLIGSELPGTVKRVSSEPYEYTVPSTGEIITLSHSFEYVPEQAPTIEQPHYVAPIMAEV